MRKGFLWLSILIVLPLFAVSQSRKHSIALYSSLLNGGTAFNKLNGFASSTRVNNSSFAGVEYGITVSSRFRLHAAIEYAKYQVTEFEGATERDGSIQFLTLPVFLQADVWKYFFYNFGLVIDLQANSDVRKARPAVGIMGGGGFKYDLSNTIRVFINPFCEIHGITSPPVSLIATGVRTGIGFYF